MEWVHIQFEDGSNPYICKTEKEYLRLKLKYKDRMKKIKDGFYFVRSSEYDELKEDGKRYKVLGSWLSKWFLDNYETDVDAMAAYENPSEFTIHTVIEEAIADKENSKIEEVDDDLPF